MLMVDGGVKVEREVVDAGLGDETPLSVVDDGVALMS